MLSLLVALALAAPVDARDRSSAPADSTQERAQSGVALEAAHFSIPGYRTGEYVTLLPSLRVTGGPRWWGALVAPVHYLSFVGAQEVGLGDLRIASGYGVYR